MRRSPPQLIVSAAIGFCLLPSVARAEDKGPIVFAAASLEDTLDGANAAWGP